VSLIGYTEARVTDVAVVQGQATLVEVGLEPTVVEAAGAEAVVTAARVALRQDVTASVYAITGADEQLTLSQPNDRYQFPGLVFAQPGVVPDSTFYPHVRGARSNQVGYFLDGIPITEPNANVFATNIVSIGLDRLELFTGGYPAEYGGFTGGIINQVVKRGDQIRGSLVDVAGGSPYDFGGLIVESGDVEDRLNWYYGLNTWHSSFNENLFTSSAPTSSDHMAKVIYDAGGRDSVTVLAHHGYARYLMPWQRMWSFDPAAADWFSVRESDDYGRQGHNLDAITLNHTVDPKAFWTLRLSRLQHFLELELGDPENLFWQHRNERMFTGQFDYERQIGGHRVRGGIWQVNSDNDSSYSVLLFPAGFVSDNDLRTNRLIYGIRSLSRGTNFAGYINMSDDQLPTGISIDTNFVYTDDLNSPTGRAIRVVISSGPLPPILDIVFSSTVAHEYYGAYHVYIRGQQTSGAAGSMSVELWVVQGEYQDILFSSQRVYTADTNEH